MKKSVFKYDSLYEYLDVALADIPQPTHKQIKQAKKTYWRLWFKHYHRQRREVRKEFTLGFNKQSLQLIHQKRGKQSVSKFLYGAVVRALGSNSISIGNKEQLDSIHLNLMQLINLVEELLDTELYEVTVTVLGRLEVLELQLHQLKNNNQ